MILGRPAPGSVGAIADEVTCAGAENPRGISTWPKIYPRLRAFLLEWLGKQDR